MSTEKPKPAPEVASDDGALVDALVSRATEKLLSSKVFKFTGLFMFGVAALVGVGVGVGTYQVKTVSDRAAQATTEINRHVMTLENTVNRALENARKLDEQVKSLGEQTNSSIKSAQVHALELLGSADIKNLAMAKESLASLQAGLKTAVAQQQELEKRIQQMDQSSNFARAFPKLRQEIDDMRAEIGNKIATLDKLAGIGSALENPVFWLIIGLPILLCAIAGFLIGRFSK